MVVVSYSNRRNKRGEKAFRQVGWNRTINLFFSRELYKPLYYDELVSSVILYLIVKLKGEISETETDVLSLLRPGAKFISEVTVSSVTL